MDARMITVHDLYAFEPGMKVAIDPAGYSWRSSYRFSVTWIEPRAFPDRIQPAIDFRRRT